MNAAITATVALIYFVFLIVIGKFSSKKGDNKTFFTAEKKSPWYLIAFGMIGTSISGVTFISVPGEVGVKSFAYLQFVMGNLVGYACIIYFLLPLYYKMNLTSIYTYLDKRFGTVSHKTGSSFFLVSRTFGCAARLFLAVFVFQKFIFDSIGLPFWISALISVGLIMAYSIKGGVKTIIYTDTLQTIFLVLSLILSIYFLCSALNFSILDSIHFIENTPSSKIFNWDINSKLFFWKQFVAGIFITIAMTGLDQDLMQKNLTCKSLKESQKNMKVFSLVFVFVVLMFLSLGALLYQYAAINGIDIPKKTDDLFPSIAVNHFSLLFGIIFIIGLTAATFASADSALTSLTTSFCLDILNMDENEDSIKNKHLRYKSHIGFSFIIFLIVIAFEYFNNDSIISTIFKLAGLTYGPLLALFSFGIFSNRKPIEKYVPWICLFGPISTYLLDVNSSILLGSYKFGFETLLINAGIIYILLLFFSKQSSAKGDLINA